MNPRKILCKFLDDFIYKRIDCKLFFNHPGIYSKFLKEALMNFNFDINFPITETSQIALDLYKSNLERIIKTKNVITVFEVAYTMSQAVSSEELLSAMMNLQNQVYNLLPETLNQEFYTVHYINSEYYNTYVSKHIKKSFIFMINEVFAENGFLKPDFEQEELISCIEKANLIELLSLMKTFSKIQCTHFKTGFQFYMFGSFTAFIPILEHYISLFKI